MSTLSYMGGKTPNPSQRLFAGAYPECKERYFLGTPGCGKTEALIAEVNRYCIEYPGSTWLLARFLETESASILKGDYLKVTHAELLGRWDHEERRQYHKNGSSVYIHGLKPSEGQSEFGKFAGYNLSGVAVSQVEQIPPRYIEALSDRLRHPSPPRVILAEGNFNIKQDDPLYPVISTATVLKERQCSDCGLTIPWVLKSGPRVIITGNLDDNAENLPADFIASKRAQSPPGHPEHNVRVAGWFGILVQGQPVYAGVFDPKVHIMECEVDPEAPVLEAWDFGITHPAVTWSQLLRNGRLRVLGEYMGTDVMLDGALAEVRRVRNLWFNKAKVFWATADPAGEAKKDTGKSSLQFLRDKGYAISPAVGANTPAIRLWAIQQVSRFMSQRVAVAGTSHEGFGIHPRCTTLIEGFKGGYVKNPKRNDGMPLKDGWYDHVANCLEYTVTAFWNQRGVDNLLRRSLPTMPQPAWR